MNWALDVLRLRADNRGLDKALVKWTDHFGCPRNIHAHTLCMLVLRQWCFQLPHTRVDDLYQQWGGR